MAGELSPPQGDDFLVLGQNSYLNPQKLQPGQYAEAENVICRDGVVQTRPGSRTLYTLPDGNLQGCTLFVPSNGIPHLVFAVEGLVYVSAYPFTSYVQLGNIQFSNTSKYIAWASCIQTTDYTDEGDLYFLTVPRSVLIMQDGATRAAYWDGSTNGHINPTPSATEATQPGYDGTPMGLWMCWSNNRLWVSRGSQVFASDIGNPLKFTETQYLNEGRAFYLPADCTGMIETSDQQGIICFTATSGVFINSSVQDRTQWTTGNVVMIKTVIPSIGCVSPRSITSQYGMIWWYSPKGLISLNDALRLNITSRLDVTDNEMASTKAGIAFDLSSVCGAAYENFLLQSVPFEDRWNTRTMALDQAPFQGNVNAWASHWTGWRPVEWAKGVVSGQERLFFASYDYDGKNRIWEAMLPERTDNGCPITSYFVSRQLLFDSRDYKKFDYVEVEISKLEGDASVMMAVAGVRGAFQKIGVAELSAQIGQVYADTEYGEGANAMGGYSAQTRLIRSDSSGSNASACNAEAVETQGKIAGLIDKAFSLMVVWSGALGVSSYRMFVRSEPNVYAGACETPDSSPALLNEDGCGVFGLFSDSEPFVTYTSTKTYSARNHEDNVEVSSTQSAESKISQEDADRKAMAAAEAYVLAQLGEI